MMYVVLMLSGYEYMANSNTVDFDETVRHMYMEGVGDTSWNVLSMLFIYNKVKLSKFQRDMDSKVAIIFISW